MGQTNSSADVPRLISYQGSVMHEGKPVTGEYQIKVTFYSDDKGKHIVWQSTYQVEVKDGIFNVILGSGIDDLPLSEELNKPMWVGVAISGEAEMKPYTQLASVPYALNVPNGSITKEKLSSDLQNQMTHVGGKQEQQAVGNPVLLGGNPYTVATGLEWIGSQSFAANPLSVGSKEVWFKVNSQVVMRYLPATLPNIVGGSGSNSVTTIDGGGIVAGGGPTASSQNIANAVSSECATVSGGTGNIAGSTDNSNKFQTIGGGLLNTATGDDAVIAGGDSNQAHGDESGVASGYANLALGSRSNVAGGRHNIAGNTIGTNNTLGIGIGAFVGGGEDTANTAIDNNVANANNSSIVGGHNNLISVDGQNSTIGGGHHNEINSMSGAIGGGANNLVSTSSSHSGVFNGRNNIVRSPLGVIGGGDTNTIQSRSENGTIGGGHINIIDTLSPFSFIGGGTKNLIQNAARSAIAGGDTNSIIDGSDHGFIGGGGNNTIWANGAYNLIAGGHCNWIFKSEANDPNGAGTTIYSTIGGGYQNRIWRSTSSFIGGGYINKVEGLADYGTIGGGYKNKIDTASDYDFIGGGYWNRIDPTTDYSVIGGGYWNKVRSNYSTIGGGYYNLIQNNALYGTIAGGDTNIILKNWGAIGGGINNIINGVGLSATIPGGENLIAQSYAQTVIGYNNRSQGGVQRGTSHDDLLTGNDRLFIIGNGNTISTRSNAFEVSYNGHSIVYHTNGSGGAASMNIGGVSSNGGPPATNESFNRAIAGATYRDNIIYASADVEPNMGFFDGLGNFHDDPNDQTHVIVHYDFGVKSVKRINLGEYEIVLALEDPVTQSPKQFNNNIVLYSSQFKANPVPQAAQQLSVVATVINDEWREYNTIPCGGDNHCPCAIAEVSRVRNNTFRVYIYCPSACHLVDRSFNFIVTGRPLIP